MAEPAEDRPGRDDSPRTDAGATVDLAGLRGATVTAPGHDPAVEDWGAAMEVFRRQWGATTESLGPLVRAIVDRFSCHCGRPVTFSYDGDPTHTRGMCADCDDARCDAFPMECPYRGEGR